MTSILPNKSGTQSREVYSNKISSPYINAKIQVASHRRQHSNENKPNYLQGISQKNGLTGSKVGRTSRSYHFQKDTTIFRQNGNFSNSYQLMKNLQYYKENTQEIDVNLKNLLIIKKPGNNNEDSKYNLSFDNSGISKKIASKGQFHTKTFADQSTSCAQDIQLNNFFYHTKLNEPLKMDSVMEVLPQKEQSTETKLANQTLVAALMNDTYPKRKFESPIKNIYQRNDTDRSSKSPQSNRQKQSPLVDLLKSKYVQNHQNNSNSKYNYGEGSRRVITNELSPKLNKSLQSISINLKNTKSIIQNLNQDISDRTTQLYTLNQISDQMQNSYDDSNYIGVQNDASQKFYYSQQNYPKSQIVKNSQADLQQMLPFQNVDQNSNKIDIRLLMQKLQEKRKRLVVNSSTRVMTSRQSNRFNLYANDRLTQIQNHYSNYPSSINKDQGNQISSVSLQIKRQEIKRKDYLPSFLQKLNGNLDSNSNNQLSFYSGTGAPAYYKNMSALDQQKLLQNNENEQRMVVIRKSVFIKNTYEGERNNNNSSIIGGNGNYGAQSRTMLSTDRSQDDTFENRMQRLGSGMSVNESAMSHISPGKHLRNSTQQ
ncbi:UNKNOWN [Stylonychia lemnae]|uniref:Uncharacterized protein n=1 Tax=Stylonychia lemnae TaxID=5949 RepID=A0A078B963_STYLE|nr:UNKNOWN [Stylonychia lemnae]|eukprot:CDW91060.1 UNKNOWN [Stylonychia lemnae]